MSNKHGSPAFEQSYVIRSVTPTVGFLGELWVDPDDGSLWVCTQESPVVFTQILSHVEDHDHDGSPTQQLAAANTHGSPSASTHHSKYTDAEAVQAIVHFKTITIENPGAAEDISMYFTATAITISEIRAVLVGSSTPSVTWTVRHGTDRAATGAEVVTSGTTTTSTTSGDDVTSFNDATIVANSFVWIETTAQSGTVTEISITIGFTHD